MTSRYLVNFEPLEDPVTLRQKLAPTAFTQGAKFPFEGRAFPVGKQLYAYYYAYLPDYVSSPTVDLLWMQTGAASGGTVQWVTYFAAISPGDPVRLSDKTFAPGNTVSTSANDDQILTKSTVTQSGLSNDSLAAGDLLVVRVTREPSVVSCGGTAVLLAASINYTGT